MKKIFFLISILAMAVVFIAAAIPSNQKVVARNKKGPACGYRIIEYGIGIDCNGDTVKLERSKGFQRLMSEGDK